MTIARFQKPQATRIWGRSAPLTAPRLLQSLVVWALVFCGTAPTLAASAGNEKRPVVFQLVVRHFGNSNSTNKTSGTLEENGSGKFADISEKALLEIRNLGVTHIWLTGVLQQATATDHSEIGEPADDPDIVKGRAGSFYAIKDYFDVCPDYAVDPANRLVEFKELVARIHQAGMKVMIDLVPNHVARSYYSNIRPELNLGTFDEQRMQFKKENNFVYVPEKYQAPLIVPSAKTGWTIEGMDGRFESETGAPGKFVKGTGNRVISTAPSPTDWYETVVLNYGYNFLNQSTSESFLAGLKAAQDGGAQEPLNSTWRFIDEVIKYWSTEFAVDGFRVDFAHWVPFDAWQWILRSARERKPSLYFVAEAYENLEGLLDAGFDAVYDDQTYDTLKGIQNHSASLWQLRSRLLARSDTRRNRYLQYLENHDERRFASPIVYWSAPDSSGFGDMNDIRLYGPVQFFAAGGPILIYNGQTVGEAGEGYEGFDSENGKTSIFDYWQPPNLARWVNGGHFGFEQLSPAEVSLHAYYASMLEYAQESDFRSDKFYLLNDSSVAQRADLLAFARYEWRTGKLRLVVANFGGERLGTNLQLPAELVNTFALLGDRNRVTLEFTREGRDGRQEQSSISRSELIAQGLRVEVPPRTSVVYAIESIAGEQDP